MNKDIERVLIPREQIKERVRELALEIAHDYKDKNLLVLCILKGASVFFADLMRDVDMEVQFEFIGLSSYRNSVKSTGKVEMTRELTGSVEGRDVLIIEDIVDTGRTLTFLKKHLFEGGARSVKICTLLDKKCKRQVELDADYVGFVVPDEFIVGYGLDYAEKYRNLNDVCILKREIYEKKT